MNKALFKATLRANWMLGLFIALIILMYVSVSISMYDPGGTAALNEMLDMMPKGFMKALGFDNLGSDLTGYLADFLYGFIMIMFPLIYTAITANKLIAKHVDSGSMAYLLTTPNTRVKIATTQAVYLIASIAVIFVFNVSVAIIMSGAVFPGMLDIGKFLGLNLVTFLVVVAVGGIGFFFSCLFDETRYSLGLGAGVPIICIMFKMLSEISDKIAWLKYLSIYSFINIDKIFANGSYVILASSILIVIIGVLYIVAIRIFNARSLSI